MRLLELWPYALIAISGAALVVVLMMLLVAPHEPSSAPRRGRTGRRVRVQRDEDAAVRAPTRSPATVLRPEAARAAEPPRPMPDARERVAGFAAALQSLETRPASPGAEGQFEIPAFLRREPGSGERAAERAPEPVPQAQPLANGLGRLVFEPPLVMRQRVGELVTVRVLRERQVAAPALTEILGAGGARRGQGDEAGADSLAVSLLGAEGAFLIEPRTPMVQVLGEGRETAEWIFRVTPLGSGRGRLDLVVAGSQSGGGRTVAAEEERIAAPVGIRMDRRGRALGAARIAAAILGIIIVAWVVAARAAPIAPERAALRGLALSTGLV